jgi:hypothetical protein
MWTLAMIEAGKRPQELDNRPLNSDPEFGAPGLMGKTPLASISSIIPSLPLIDPNIRF